MLEVMRINGSGRWLQLMGILCATLAAAGCSRSTVSVSALGRKYAPEGIVVLPFKNDRDGIVTSAFQSGLLKLGWRVVERARMKDVLSEEELQALYNYRTTGAEEIRRKLNADVVVLGEVTEYRQGVYVELPDRDSTNSYYQDYDARRRERDEIERQRRKREEQGKTVVGFSAKAVVIKSAELLWDASILHDGGMFSYGTPVKADAIKAVNIVIDELIDQGAQHSWFH